MVALDVFVIAALMNKTYCSALCKPKMFPCSGPTRRSMMLGARRETQFSTGRGKKFKQDSLEGSGQAAAAGMSCSQRLLHSW